MPPELLAPGGDQRLTSPDDGGFRLENLPPDVRKKLEESLRQQGLPGR